MTDAQALRHQLRAAGFCPIPLYGKEPPIYGKNNKRKGLKRWQELGDVTPEQIDLWSTTWPDAINTGALCRTMPTLDLDILSEDAVRTIEDHVREHYEENGYVLPRIGKPPKRAIPFRTEEPFKKFAINLIAADGSEGQKIEFLADGEQVVVAGIHPGTQQPYRWPRGELGAIRLGELPYIREAEARALVDDLVEILVRDFGYKRAPSRSQQRQADGVPKPDGGQGKGESDWTHLYENIRAGRDLHDSLRTLAAKMIACGTNSGAAINQLRALMESSAVPKDDRWRARVREIPDAVDSAVAKYGKQPEPIPEPAPTGAKSFTIDDVIAVFKKWLVLKDPTPIYAMLGTIAANLLDGDPVWLGLIAPPSSAKTELLNSISGLPHVIQAATVTPSGLLSGTSDKQKDKGARGGLLRQIDSFGGFGIICLKDFGSVLSMHAETRAETLAALREVYDGAWTRHLGSGGGKTLAWKGKVAVIFAATEVIDSHHAVMGAMGDRFLLSRLKPVAGQKQFDRALRHVGSSISEMRQELATAVARLFKKRRQTASPINDQERIAIGTKIALAVRLRGAVARDYRSREIEAIYGAEGTARIGLALERLLAGLETLGMARSKALEIATAVALDSVPPLRRAAYDCVCKYRDVETGDVAIELGLPTTTIRRIKTWPPTACSSANRKARASRICGIGPIGSGRRRQTNACWLVLDRKFRTVPGKSPPQTKNKY
jgi:hypothetical protein